MVFTISAYNAQNLGKLQYICFSLFQLQVFFLINFIVDSELADLWLNIYLGIINVDFKKIDYQCTCTSF